MDWPSGRVDARAKNNTAGHHPDNYYRCHQDHNVGPTKTKCAGVAGRNLPASQYFHRTEKPKRCFAHTAEISDEGIDQKDTATMIIPAKTGMTTITIIAWNLREEACADSCMIPIIK